MGVYRRVPIMDGTTLRLGGCTEADPGVDNVIEVLRATGGHRTINLPAIAQCAGQEIVDEQGNSNYWWVLVDTGTGTRGWVSAVRIAEGGNDKPIDDVHKGETVVGRPASDGPDTWVTLVKGGATLRRGVSRRSEPDNAIGSLPGGQRYLALAQCGGEEIRIGAQSNVRWVLLDTPLGIGWVSAVLVKEGENRQAVPGVQSVPTRFTEPPDPLA